MPNEETVRSLERHMEEAAKGFDITNMEQIARELGRENLADKNAGEIAKSYEAFARRLAQIANPASTEEAAGMSDDLTKYRLDQYEKKAEAADARMARVEDKLGEISITLAKLPTTGALWTMVATVIGISVAFIAVIVGVLTYLQAFHH